MPKGFQKGKVKTGGRQKGVLNKKNTIFDSLETIVTERGDPIDVVKLFFDGLMTMPPFQRVDALLKFMEFIYPKQKNVELTTGEGGFKIIIEDYCKKPA